MFCRRGFLSALATAIFQPVTNALAVDDVSASRRLDDRASSWAPLSESTRIQKIVDDLYFREKLSGDVATIDYAIFDLGLRTQRVGRTRGGATTGTQITPAGENLAVPCLALRETRFGRPQVRLALYDGDRDDAELATVDASPRGLWRSGPVVGSDLVILRAPADARDPLAPGLPAPWSVVLDQQGVKPRFWTIAAARLFAPLDGRLIRPEGLPEASSEDAGRLRDRLAQAKRLETPERILLLPSTPGRSGAIIGLKRDGGVYLTASGLYFSPGPVLIDAAGEVYLLADKVGAAFPVRRF